MATNLDSLQIEIISSSAGAVRSIQDLAGALGELKKNGKITTAVNNLNNLRKALHSFANIPSNASKVLSLAGSLEKLKGVGSVTAIGNSLTKLASSLKTLDTVRVNKEKIDSIASALGSLSAVKAGGINTMMNGLAKMGKVTASLDDDAINAFAERVEKLSEKLTPLSTKMTTVQAGLKGINSTARSAGSSVKKMGDDVDGAKVNFASFIYAIQEVVQLLQQAIQKFSDFMAEAIEWDGISSRFGRGFGNQAQDTYEWIQRLNEEMGINIQQFMKYSSVYATMLTGFGVAHEDATKMALGYTELTYDIWAGYNDIYKNFDDAAEAVKSAIAGEVEPIRRAGFTIVESTLEQTAANHGLTISLESATEAQKSYLRYLTLVDQAHAQGLIGTYAKELQTAEGLMRTFAQQTKSLTQAFGSLFLPILVQIMPYLQAFVELLTEGIQAIAAFFGVEIMGVDWSGYNDGVGGAVEGTDDLTGSMNDAAAAAKELKNAAIGIDELNVISPPSASSGSGGTGGSGGGNGFSDLDIDSLWDESVFSEIGNQVDKIKEKLRAWMPVVEAIAGIFAAMGVTLLIAQLGESMEAIGQLEGFAGNLKKTLAGLAVLTIEAVLVFMFADEYLETGNILPAIGQALATVAGGFLMYKGFGTNGLLLSLGVSMAMQLVAITMNLADGGVEIDDPQLWIQAAMTTLTGAAGGLFAFKKIASVGAGKGALLGAAISLSLSLAAITIGGVAADGFDLVDGLTGALSTALGGAAGAGLFTMLGIASGGTGFLVGGAIALAVNVIGAIVASVSKDAEKSLEEDLESRFGDVELTLSEARVIIGKLIPKWAEGVNQAVELREGVESLIKSIETQEGVLGSYEWQVSVGLVLTEGENKKYRAAIDNFIAACQDYVSERGYALEVGLKATTSTEAIIESANNISVEATAELESLGKQLQEAINTAYEDGLLDIDELKAIQNIRNDMREIVNALKSSEIEAEFSMLEMKWSGVNLTADSFETMMEEWNDTIKNTIKPALEATVKENLKTLEGNVAFAKMQLEKNPGDAEAQQMLLDAEAALQAYIDENPLERLTLEANIQAVTFAINTLQDAFAEEIARVENQGLLDFGNNLNLALEVTPNVKFDDGNGEVYGNIEDFVYKIQYYMGNAQYELSKSARKNLESMLEEMTPTMADFEKLAEENRKAGVTVVQSVRDGLNDYNELKALSGDVDGINYMIGKGFSTDPTFLNTLATVEDAGSMVDKHVAKGLLNNIDYVKDEATGIVVGIKDAVTGKVTYITPTLKNNLAQMGVNLGDALGGKYKYVYDQTTGVLTGIVDSVTGNKVWVNSELKTAGENAGKDLNEGLKKGIDDPGEKQTLMEKIKGWGNRTLDWMRTTFEIHSPSKATERMGKDLTAGLQNGMSIDGIQTKISSMWTTAKTWWDTKKGNLSTYTPSIGNISTKLSSAWTTAKDWWNKNRSSLSYTPSIGSISEKLKTAWTGAKDWWNKSRTSLSYTPTIGSISTKLSSAWTTAKNWWNKSRSSLSYTPTIGSIKDKLSSAWTTAKNWWNNTKSSLSAKLSISTPSLSVKWGEVSALGKTFKYPTGFSLKYAADGGIFDQGSLVWAGERGPEILANAAGGKTGVMNVQQMQDAVYEGVYAAVVAAMSATSGNNNSQPVNVYLDGKQITSTVEQRQRERGASIMGNQVYSY